MTSLGTVLVLASPEVLATFSIGSGSAEVLCFSIRAESSVIEVAVPFDSDSDTRLIALGVGPSLIDRFTLKCSRWMSKWFR